MTDKRQKPKFQIPIPEKLYMENWNWKLENDGSGKDSKFQFQKNSIWKAGIGNWKTMEAGKIPDSNSRKTLYGKLELEIGKRPEAGKRTLRFEDPAAGGTF